MRIVIDKANLIKIISQPQHSLRRDAEVMFQCQLDIEFNFTRKERDEDEAVSMFFTALTEGRGPKTKDSNEYYYLEEGEPPFVLKDDIHLTWPRKHTAFLIDGPESVVDVCQKKGQLMVFGLGQEFDFFNLIFLKYPYRESHHPLRIGGAKFQNWAALRSYVTPLTDIILIDRYITSDKSLIEHNLLSFIRLLHSNKQSHTNIVVLTDKDQMSVSVKELQQKIKNEVKKAEGCSANVTVVRWQHQTKDNRINQAHINTFEEHDRTLITNYTRWKSGDTFNYFNSSNQRITKGREIDIYSLARREYLSLVKDLLDDINKYVKWCKENHPENIDGDRISGLLEIPPKSAK